MLFDPDTAHWRELTPDEFWSMVKAKARGTIKA
jgi:hypothetical protein